MHLLLLLLRADSFDRTEPKNEPNLCAAPPPMLRCVVCAELWSKNEKGLEWIFLCEKKIKKTKKNP